MASHVNNCRPCFYILADTKKTRLCIVVLQLVQYPWRDLGMGTVIKAEVDLFFRCRYLPVPCGVEHAEESVGG